VTLNRPAWLATELYPFTSRRVEIGGHRIHYIDEGAGPTLLLLHGNPTWSFLYRHIVRRLSPRVRCVALDLPGFGLSQAEPGYDYLPLSHARVVEAFIEAVGITAYTPMVQDWGGPIGLWVAGRHAARVEGLIIGNTWAWPIDGDAHFERFSAVMGGAVGGFFIGQFNAFVNVMIPAGIKRAKLSAAEMACYRAPFPTVKSRAPTNIFPREIRASGAFLAEVAAGLAHLRDKAALILWGDRDVAFRPSERERFEGLFPNHVTVPLPGAGHFIQEDSPGEIVEAIEAWWPKVATAPR